jgi:hypothetical protein
MLIKHVYKIEVKSTQSQESTELAQNAGVNIRWIGARDRLPMNAVRLYAEFNGTLNPSFDVQSV